MAVSHRAAPRTSRANDASEVTSRLSPACAERRSPRSATRATTGTVASSRATSHDAEVAGGGDGDPSGRRGEQEDGGDGAVARAGPAVVEQGEGGRGGQEDARLERRGARAGGPQARAVRAPGGRGCAAAPRPRRGCPASRPPLPRRARAPPPGSPTGHRARGRTASPSEDEDQADHGCEGRGEDQRVERHDGVHRAPPIVATASAVTESSSIGATPSTTTSPASPASTQRSTPDGVGRPRELGVGPVTRPDDAGDPQGVGGGEGRTDGGDDGADDEQRARPVGGRVPRGVHGEELAPEPGEARQPEARREAEHEDEARAGARSRAARGGGPRGRPRPSGALRPPTRTKSSAETTPCATLA